jgi:hypothetical protein
MKKELEQSLDPSFIISYDFSNLLLLNAQRKNYGTNPATTDIFNDSS